MKPKKIKPAARTDGGSSPELREQLEALRDRQRFNCSGESALLARQAIDAFDAGDETEARRLAMAAMELDSERESAELVQVVNELSEDRAERPARLDAYDSATLRAAFQTLDAVLLKSRSEAERPPPPAKVGKEATAIGILALHPGWSDKQIAAAAGCSRTTLYTFEKYVMARDIMRKDRNHLPRGTKYPGEAMESWDNDGDG